MKKGIRKMLSAIACATLAMGCLAGCSSNTNSSVANTTTESAAENTSTAAAETAVFCQALFPKKSVRIPCF